MRSKHSCPQPYFVPDALNPGILPDPGVFLNGMADFELREALQLIHISDNRVLRAIHAPTSKNYSAQMDYPFGSTYVARE